MLNVETTLKHVNFQFCPPFKHQNLSAGDRDLHSIMYILKCDVTKPDTGGMYFTPRLLGGANEWKKKIQWLAEGAGHLYSFQRSRITAFSQQILIV